MTVTRRRVAIAAGGLLVAWIVFLVIAGVLYGDRKAQGIADRIGETLQSTATVGTRDLALVRGRFSFEHLQVKRDDAIGKLSLDVGEVRCELAPLGIALLDSSCRELAISDVSLELTTFALFKLRRPTRPPIHARRVVIDRAALVFSPSAIAESLGRVRLVIDHAEAGPTTFKTPLSWLFQLETLRATLELPFGVIKLAYDNGRLTAAGGLFGRTPVSITVKLPSADALEEPAAEVKRLVKLGRELAEQLVDQKARAWLQSLTSRAL